MLSILEQLQQTNPSAEIWWDSSPLDFPRWRASFLEGARDETARGRWAAQLDRFLIPGRPTGSLVRGVTTNPSLVAKSVLAAPDLWAAEIREQIRCQRSPDIEGTFALLYGEAVGRAATAMLPLWEATDGQYGWVSGQLDPRHMFDAERMLDQALRLARRAPNLMVKVPGTLQGYDVVRQLVARGISVNSTLSYTVPQFVSCARAVREGLEQARREGTDTSRWRAVFTHMIGRFGSQGDLPAEAATRGIELSPADVRWAEIAVAKRIHRMIQEDGLPVKMLLSSLETDDPARGMSSLSMHLEQSAGGAIAYTCKPQFIADIMRRDGEFRGFDAHAIDGDVPPAVWEKLMRLPSFHRAITPHGMAPEEFASYGSFVSTYSEVIRNTRRLIDFVAHQLELSPPREDALLVSGSIG
ncbi:transaldolase family protein [Streptomyces blastmyceticus]|uniref:Transaldolase n=1 Tax=Streptomyces blastmyceticus TaxID=68180 RepID=A0ABP3HP88_9ACTN